VSGAAGHDWGSAGRGQAQPSRTRAAPARIGRDRGWAGRSGAGCGRGGSTMRTCGGGARGSDARERSWRKKRQAQVLYPLMFVRPTHQPMNLSGLADVAVVAPYVYRPPDEHKLCMSV
jgi:hypothetical protein